MIMRLVVVLGLGIALAGCGSLGMGQSANEPVGVGPGRDEYKKSPCACYTIPQREPDAALFRRLGLPS